MGATYPRYLNRKASGDENIGIGDEVPEPVQQEAFP
jgi:hypothetical protein